VTTAASEWPGANTQHGMLVALGEFLSQHGLIERLMNVPIPQKTRRFPPQAKLVEFLAGITGGLEHLEDLNNGPRPLAKDQVVAQAWGQLGFAHYSSVSRTLEACTDATVTAVMPHPILGQPASARVGQSASPRLGQRPHLKWARRPRPNWASGRT